MSAEVIAFMVIGGCCIIAFGFYESYANLKYPLMPMSFFRNRGYISLVTIITISSMCYYAGLTNMQSVQDRLNGPDRTGGNILESAFGCMT